VHSRRNSILCAAAALLMLAGCGQGLNPHRGLPAVEQLLTRADIARFPRASPQAALLTWWRDVQFDDLIGYLRFLPPSVASAELNAGAAQRYLMLLSGQLQAAKPRITGANIMGKSATIYTQIYYRQAVSNTQWVTTSSPQAFSLVNNGGSWQLADDYFIRQRVGSNGS
jgi:hypothetical protein